MAKIRMWQRYIELFNVTLEASDRGAIVDDDTSRREERLIIRGLLGCN